MDNKKVVVQVRINWTPMDVFWYFTNHLFAYLFVSVVLVNPILFFLVRIEISWDATVASSVFLAVYETIHWMYRQRKESQKLQKELQERADKLADSFWSDRE